MAGRYMHYSPSAGGSPQLVIRSSTAAVDHDKYLSELLAERQNLCPFMQVLPNCSRLLNQEIMRVTTLVGKLPYLDQDGLDHRSPLPVGTPLNDGGSGDLNGWGERLVIPQVGWHGTAGASAGLILKKTQRIDIPIDKYPNYNFVGRILGPRGNSLKRVEATTGCRVLIRGRGSIKDIAKEDKMRDKPGFEHLNEPLHVLVEAELPANIIDVQLSRAREILHDLLKPVNESFDAVKKAQLRELATLNGALREENLAHMSGTASPFNNPGMKRAKTRR